MTGFDLFRLFVWLVATIGGALGVVIGVVEWADSRQYYGMPEALAAMAAVVVGECLMVVVSMAMWVHGWGPPA